MRWPFEKIGFFNQKSVFYRIHETFFQIPKETGERAAGIQADSVALSRTGRYLSDYKNKLPLSRYNAKILNHRNEVECMIAIIDYDAGTCAVWKKPAFTGGNACHNQGQENDTQSGQGHSAGGGLLWPSAMGSWSSMVWWM